MARGKTSDNGEAAEAYAFLRVLAPKLEQLRRRLTASRAHLNDADAAAGRLNAIVESQLALKEFLSGLANFNPLVEPIDILLALLNEEAADPSPAPEPLAPEPLVAAAAPAPPRAKAEASPDAGLRAGTRVALDKLTAAGMHAASAATYLANAYAAIGLTLKDGTPLSPDLIAEWSGPKSGGWRSGRSLVRKAGAPKGPAAVAEAQARVNELATIFKKMTAAANG